MWVFIEFPSYCEDEVTLTASKRNTRLPACHHVPASTNREERQAAAVVLTSPIVEIRMRLGKRIYHVTEAFTTLKLRGAMKPQSRNKGHCQMRRSIPISTCLSPVADINGQLQICEG